MMIRPIWARVRDRCPGRPDGFDRADTSLASSGRSSLRVGDRVFLLQHTDDFRLDSDAYKARDFVFHGEPNREGYGKVDVFEALYSYLRDLSQLGAKDAYRPPRPPPIGPAGPSRSAPGQ
jgi:hypothetical protein